MPCTECKAWTYCGMMCTGSQKQFQAHILRSIRRIRAHFYVGALRRQPSVCIILFLLGARQLAVSEAPGTIYVKKFCRTLFLRSTF